MSEKEKRTAIAKLQARGCRRWMTSLIVAPIFICAALTVLAPMIRQYLARGDAQEFCQSVEQTELASNSTMFESSELSGEALITEANIEEMVLFGEETLASPVQSRDYIPAIGHPNGDYVIHAVYQPSYATEFYICNDSEALGAFTADETARDVVFNQSGSLFAVSNGRYGTVMIFDGIEIRRKQSINIRGSQQFRQIDSVAFHPTESLLFFTSEDELFVYETDHFTLVFHLPIFEVARHEIGFNADGTLFFMSPIGEGTLSYVWGVRE